MYADDDGAREEEAMTSNTNAVRCDRRATLVGFGCGLVAGAILGTLWAPAQGRDTRAAVRRRASAASTRTAAMIRERRQRLHGFIRRHGVVGLLRRAPVDAAAPGAETAG